MTPRKGYVCLIDPEFMTAIYSVFSERNKLMLDLNSSRKVTV
jgi:hypothetical protein